MTESRSLRRDPERLLRLVAKGQAIRVPLTSDLHVIAKLFAGVDPGRTNGYPLGPDMPACVASCSCAGSGRTCWTVAGRIATPMPCWPCPPTGGSSVHTPDDWETRSHNAYKQFHALVRHLTARYDVPTFLNTAWLKGVDRRGRGPPAVVPPRRPGQEPQDGRRPARAPDPTAGAPLPHGTRGLRLVQRAPPGKGPRPGRR